MQAFLLIGILTVIIILNLFFIRLNSTISDVNYEILLNQWYSTIEY